MKPKLIDVLHPIAKDIAQELEDHEDVFREDPELYIVALLLEVRRRIQRGGGTIYSDLELTPHDKNMDEARKLLRREKVTSK